MRLPASLLVAIGFAVAATQPARTQTVPSTTASAEERPNFSGTWSLDRTLSNDPSQVNFGASGQSGQRSGGAGSRRRGGAGGYGGSGSSNGNTGGTSTPDEQAHLKALTDTLKQASATLVISHHDPSFVVNDAQDHTQFFQTTGSRDEHQLASTTVTSTTRWDASRLVTEYALSSRQTLVYTYTLLPATKQLVLRVRLDATQGQRGNGQELKLVYRLAPDPK